MPIVGDRHLRDTLLPRIAYMPQGLGRNLHPTFVGYRNVDFCPPVWATPPNVLPESKNYSTPLASTVSRSSGSKTLRRHETKTRPAVCALIHDPDSIDFG